MQYLFNFRSNFPLFWLCLFRNKFKIMEINSAVAKAGRVGNYSVVSFVLLCSSYLHSLGVSSVRPSSSIGKGKGSRMHLQCTWITAGCTPYVNIWEQRNQYEQHYWKHSPAKTEEWTSLLWSSKATHSLSYVLCSCLTEALKLDFLNPPHVVYSPRRKGYATEDLNMCATMSRHTGFYITGSSSRKNYVIFL